MTEAASATRTESFEKVSSSDTRFEPITEVFSALGCSFAVTAPSPEIARAIRLVYGEMRPTTSGDDSTLPITIVPSLAHPEHLEVRFDGELIFVASRLGDLLHQLDNELTIALEHARPDLYFVHAAALENATGVTLLVGDSGAGKSTTTYALAASGMGYLSDELAAIEPRTGRVLAYPRAICLKRDPPAPLVLPTNHLRTEWTLHVRPRDLSSPIVSDGAVLTRILFVRWSPQHLAPELRPLHRSEAALRLYKGALNQLAHPAFGLDETLGLIARSHCGELLTAGIEATVELVRGSIHAGH